MFSQLVTKQTRISLVIFSRHKSTFPLTSTYIPSEKGYDTTKFSPPPLPKKSNKATKGKAKLLEQLAKKELESATTIETETAIIQVSENTTAKQETSIEEESAKKIGIRVIAPPKLASESSFKFDDKKRFKNELKLKRFEYSLGLGLAVSKNEKQQSIDNNGIERLQQSREELELKQRKKVWYKKINQERQEKLDKINETIKILSLSSNSKEFCANEYSEMKRKNALENYRKRELEKRRERRVNLLTLYYNSSDFVTLNNLDTKIAEMYIEARQPFTTTLEDMQIDYLEGGGIVDDLELKRRLDRIKDTLNDTAQGGNQKLGLDKIEKLHVRKSNHAEPLNSNIKREPNLLQSLDS